MQRIKPKKSLGQNFLHDKNIARKIVNHFDPRENDTVLEIGPGTGALTELLAGRCKKLYLVEKDKRAIEFLDQRYGDDDTIRIIKSDILDISIPELATEDGKLRVIGNIPYYITSPILFHILDQRRYVYDLMMLMQLEVARRITSHPSSTDYGILSVLTQTWATPAFLFKVPATVFYPKPSVDSALVHIVFNRERNEIADENRYRSVVRGTFGTRRKMLRSTLKRLYPELPLHQDHFSIDLNKRPEECSVDDFIQLTNEIDHGIKRRR